MTVDYLILCERTWQSESGQPCVANIIDDLAQYLGPEELPPLMVLAKVRARPRQIATLTLTLVDPHGLTTWTHQRRFEMGAAGVGYCSAALRGVRFTRQGRSRLVALEHALELRSIEVTTTPLPPEPDRVQ
jgi:hypothetical protein